MLRTLAALLTTTFPLQVLALEVGAPAPEFQGITDQNGSVQTLARYRGKIVVLEWLNHGCPFVKKHYASRNMQKLQKKYRAKGVVWFSVVSSAKGKQGWESPADHLKTMKTVGSNATGVLIDSDGKMGRAYGAKVTPQLFIIDPSGKVAYRGAIDDRASTNEEDIAGATNYVAAALDSLLEGKKIANPSTKPYGCSIKY